MGQTDYFDQELTRLRQLWMLAVRRHDNDAARDASTAYFERAGDLAADNRDASHDARRCSRAHSASQGRPA